jgi:alpha-tubulin suppressor-like RCC1 family protein
MGDNLSAIDLGSGRSAQKIAAGELHVCALLDSQRIKCWGGNSQGQLGVEHANSLGDGANEMGDFLPYVAF